MEELERIIKYFSKHEYLLFLFWSLYICSEYFILGPFSYVRVGDNLDSFIPRFTNLWSAFFNHGITYWYPLIAGGADRLSNEITYWNITGIFFAIYHWIAYAIILVGGIFVGSYFTYKLCRKILQLSFAPSIFAGLIFSAFFVRDDIITFIPGLCIVPVTLYFLELLIAGDFTKKNIKYLYVVLLGLLFGISSSFVFTLIFTSSFIVIWFIIRKRVNLSVLSALFIFFLVAAIFHISEFRALLANVVLSNRGGGNNYYGAGVGNFLNIVISLIKTNWISLILVYSGLFFVKNKKRIHIWLIVLVTIFLFLFPAYEWMASLYGDYFKLIRNFAFDRFYLLIPFVSALCASYTLDSLSTTFIWRKNNNNRIISLQTATVLFFILVLLISNLGLKQTRAISWLKQGSYIANTSSPDVKFLANLATKEPIFRVATIGNSRYYLISTLPQFYNLESIDAVVNLVSDRFKTFFRLLSKDDTKKISFYFLAHPDDRMIDDFKNDPEKFINFSLLSLSNVRYIITANQLSLPNFTLLETPSSKNYYDWTGMGFKEKMILRMQENFTGRKLLIYENKDVFPRFFLVHQSQVFADSSELLASLSQASTTTLRNEVFLEASDIGGGEFITSVNNTLDKVEVVKYSPDEIKLTIKSAGATWLVVGNNYSPLWEATVNGEKTKIIPVYHTFMAIFIKDGDSQLVLKYNPYYSIK